MNLENQSLGTLELIVKMKDIFEGSQDLSCLEAMLFHMKGYIDIIANRMPTQELREQFLMQIRSNIVSYIDENF